MKNFSYVVKNIFELREHFMSVDVQTNVANSKTVLVQVFSSQSDINKIKSITEVIKETIPDVIIVGVTSAGEIKSGKLYKGTTVLSISFFDDTIIKPIVASCSKSNEYIEGQNIIHRINELGSEIAGVLLLATPLSLDIAEIFRGMSKEKFEFPIFGGGAGVYNANEKPLVFCGSEFYSHGIIAAVFLNKDLHIYSKTFLGWKPLSKEMTVTEIDGMLLKKVDGVSAFKIYERYLNIKNDDSFFDNVLEFPIVVERDGETIARVPFSVDENGYIKLIADLKLGEKFRIGYGDPSTIVEKSIAIQKELYGFKPEAAFLYACICRRFLMQNDVNLETRIYDDIAPTSGFYTYGEFFSHSNKIHLLNSTMVIVGMREGKPGKFVYKKNNEVLDEQFDLPNTDPFSHKHNRIISKLLYFLNVVSSEFEEANEKLTKISEIDKLTQINNRLKLDNILNDEILRHERYNSGLSIAILDLDYFKKVNDNFGHLIGDEVLVRVASILKNSVRESDYVGRWGGEEFLIIFPQTGPGDAMVVAEKIRAAIFEEIFNKAKHITCSLGVTTILKGDTKNRIVFRADKALYIAKRSGRNQVKFSDSNDVFSVD